MNKKEIERLALSYLDRTIDLYGESKYYKHTPYLALESSPMADEYDPELKGEFIQDENEIVVYYRNIKSKEDLARTIIHEYVHYLQSPTWLARYNNDCYYDENPYEKQAFLAEELNWEAICK